MTATHELKCHHPFFDAVERGDKTFEIRNNTDRGFQAGDTLILTRVDSFAPPMTMPAAGTISPPDQPRRYTLHCLVTYVLHGEQWGLQPGYVALAIQVMAK